MRPNPTPSIYRSKAVGEPPLMLAISVYSAILDAVHATNPKGQPKLEAPVHAGVDPQRDPVSRRGGLKRRHAGLSPPHRRDRSRRLRGAGDSGPRGGLEPARIRGPHGRQTFGRLPWNDRRRGAGMGGARGGRNPRCNRDGDRRHGVRWPWVRSWRNVAAAESNGESRLSIVATSINSLRSRRRRRGDSAMLKASIGGDGRVERMLEGSRRGEGLIGSATEGKGWAEPLGQSAHTVYLFGAGHVGRALALCPCAAAVRRPLDRLAPRGFPRIRPRKRGAHPRAGTVGRELASAPDGALIVVMTHSHALDLEIVADALRSERFGFVGLIGSATKRARFLSQMRAAGLSETPLDTRLPDRFARPEGKEPAVIAASYRRAIADGQRALIGKGSQATGLRHDDSLRVGRASRS